MPGVGGKLGPEWVDARLLAEEEDEDDELLPDLLLLLLLLLDAEEEEELGERSFLRFNVLGFVVPSRLAARSTSLRARARSLSALASLSALSVMTASKSW